MLAPEARSLKIKLARSIAVAAALLSAVAASAQDAARPTPARTAPPAAGAAAAVPAKGELDRSNEQRRREMDQQHDRWTKSANQAMGSICAGCGKVEAGRPAPAKRRAPRRAPRDPDDDAGYAPRDD
jgi:hypothetical protein